VAAEVAVEVGAGVGVPPQAASSMEETRSRLRVRLIRFIVEDMVIIL